MKNLKKFMVCICFSTAFFMFNTKLTHGSLPSAPPPISGVVWTSVEDYSALGNGTTDDHDAIQNAINSGNLIGLLPNKTYLIKSAIVIGTGQTLYIPASTTLLYDYTNVSTPSAYAVELTNTVCQNGGTLIGEGRIKLYRGSWIYDDYAKAGIAVTGANCKIDFGVIEGFEFGISMYSSGASYGVAWNNINVRYIYDCLIGVIMNKASEGWINQNYIHVDNMCEHRTSSSSSQKTIWDSNSVGIYMASDGNANTFSGGIEGYKTSIIINGKYNRIEGLRMETDATITSNPISIRFEGTDTFNNYLFGEYDNSTISRISNAGSILGDKIQIFGTGDYVYLKYARARNWYTYSDSTLKKDVRTINGALDKIIALRGTTYRFKSDSKNNNKENLSYGFIAQELKKVLPELVTQDNADSLLAIDYNGVIPVLTEAIKEQETKIKSLNARVSDLEEMLKKFIQSKKDSNFETK